MQSRNLTICGLLILLSLFFVADLEAQNEIYNGKRKKYEELPNALIDKTDWQIVDLRKNKLEFFPTRLQDHKQLKELRLSRNPMTWPDSLTGFHSLEYLDMWDTDIDAVPSYVEGFKSLKKLDLRETYLDEDNREALEIVFPGVEILLSERCDCRPKK